jgi:hypothetical protein
MDSKKLNKNSLFNFWLKEGMVFTLVSSIAQHFGFIKTISGAV